jgi:hypothetical protein
VGYVVLTLAAISYAVGIVAQTVAAKRTELRGGVDPGLLARLARDRVYVVGFAAQCAGFVLAFLARADLPLYLVQAGTSSAVGLAAVLGATLLGWSIRPAEVGVLVIIAAGLVLLVGAAQPGPALELSTASALGLVALLVAAVALAVPASRLLGPRGAVPLGLLAGVAYAVLAIASRPLAARPFTELPFEPTAWLMVVAAFAGQAMLAAALQRGTTTATVASMDSMTVLLASGFGLLVLGDLVAPGRGWWLLSGLVLVVIGVLAMAAVTGRRARAAEAVPPVPIEASSSVRPAAREN